MAQAFGAIGNLSFNKLYLDKQYSKGDAREMTSFN